MTDPLREQYQDLLEGSYDCVDRIILNAYFPGGLNGGGFRCWWRALEGDDANLDNAHLMRLAGRFSRRLRAWAKANHVPVKDCPVGERKHEIAQDYLAVQGRSIAIHCTNPAHARSSLERIPSCSRPNYCVNLIR